MIIQLLLSERIGGAETLARSLEAHWTGEGVATSTIFLDEEAATSPIRRVLNLRKRLIAGRASVVVAHSALPSIYARIAAPRGVPVISVLHSATDDFVDPVLRFAEFALRMRTAAVVAVSEAQAAVYRRRFDRNLRVIPNAIRDNLPLGTGSGSCAVPTIVTVARIAIQKNPRLWLDAQGALGERAKFVWFGPLDLPASSLQEEVLAVRRESPSLFPGSVIDPGDVLASADLLFHPADREAASIGLLEAAAVGLPIVCSQAVARTLPREAVVREFETDNARSAEAVLRQALSDLASLRAAALEAAPLIRQQSSVAQTSEMYLELIGELRAVARKTR